MAFVCVATTSAPPCLAPRARFRSPGLHPNRTSSRAWHDTGRLECWDERRPGDRATRILIACGRGHSLWDCSHGDRPQQAGADASDALVRAAHAGGIARQERAGETRFAAALLLCVCCDGSLNALSGTDPGGSTGCGQPVSVQACRPGSGSRNGAGCRGVATTAVPKAASPLSAIPADECRPTVWARSRKSKFGTLFDGVSWAKAARLGGNSAFSCGVRQAVGHLQPSRHQMGIFCRLPLEMTHNDDWIDGMCIVSRVQGVATWRCFALRRIGLLWAILPVQSRSQR